MAAQTAQIRLNGSSSLSAKALTPSDRTLSANLAAIRARQAAEKVARLTRYKAYRVIQQG
jgi:hypothetical protein